MLVGRAARTGIGLRADCALPSMGTLRLVHWFASPYGDTPTGGIVEDTTSMRLNNVEPLGDDGTERVVTLQGAAFPLPQNRGERRNLLSSNAASLLGLRGWDIPHDRHIVLTDLASGSADITGSRLPDTVVDHWQIQARWGSGRMTIVAQGDEIWWN